MAYKIRSLPGNEAYLSNLYLDNSCRGKDEKEACNRAKIMLAYRSACDTINFGKAVCNSFLEKFSPLYIVSVHRTAVVESGSGQHLYNCSNLKSN